jgi:hypothetical protein
MGLPVENEEIYYHHHCMDDQSIIAQEKDDAEYMTKKLVEEYQKWDLNINILKTKYLSVGSDIQNIKLEHDIEIKGSRSCRYLWPNFTSYGVCNKEVFNRIEQARKTMGAVNSLLWSKLLW